MHVHLDTTPSHWDMTYLVSLGVAHDGKLLPNLIIIPCRFIQSHRFTVSFSKVLYETAQANADILVQNLFLFSIRSYALFLDNLTLFRNYATYYNHH